MTPDEKLQNLAQQINAAEMGMTKILKCPYCGELLDFTPPNPAMVTDCGLELNYRPPTCCAEFALAARAILERKEQQEMKDLADRIRSNVGGAAVFN